MDSETVNKLLEINREFYSQFSADFSNSRSAERFNIAPFRQFLSDGIRILDVGCGNGRLAIALAQTGLTLDYVGIDGSSELVAYARAQSSALPGIRTEFHVADLTAPGWNRSVSNRAPFDVIVSLAVLHHIPGFDLRSQIVKEFRSLLKPGGILIMSNWQFTQNDRLLKKIVDWSRVGIDPTRLDPNDYLLDWKRGGIGYRYVHLVTESEILAIAQSAHLNVLRHFHADNNLNLYSILQR